MEQVRTATAQAEGEGKTAKPRPAGGAVALLRRIGGGALARQRAQSPEKALPEPRDATPPRTKAWPSAYLISLIGLVLIPSIIAALYLFFVAADQYVAETRFAVRKAKIESSKENKLASMLSSMGSGGMPGSMADQEVHIIANYLRSRAAIDDIAKKIDIVEIFRRPEADFWERIKEKPTAEEMLDYWRDHVSAYVDGPSGVVTVKVRAFRPDDAKRLAEEFIVASENLANRLSDRARRDAERKAEEEVRRTEAMVRQSLIELRQYRDQEGFISPLATATSTSKLLLEAMSERIRLHSDYFVTSRALSPDAPSIQGLKTRIEGLDLQIEKLNGELTSKPGERRAVSAALVRYEELEIQRVFAERMYSLARDALERARVRAEQQSIYIAVFLPPYLPQESLYPERLTIALLIFVGLMLLWGIGALTAAAVEDHTL